jgi:hypothetical protein
VLQTKRAAACFAQTEQSGGGDGEQGCAAWLGYICVDTFERCKVGREPHIGAIAIPPKRALDGRELEGTQVELHRHCRALKGVSIQIVQPNGRV